jgi:hypothetical protein
MVSRPGRSGELFAQLVAQRVDLLRDPVLHVHAEQDRVAADEHGRADQHDADGNEYDREARRVVATAEQDHGRGHRG